MAKFYVYTSRASKGARALAKALHGKRIKTNFNQTVVNGLMIGAQGVTFNDDDIIINWGDSQCTHLYPLNKAAAIRLVANKLTAFDVFSSASVPIPAYARRKEDVTWEGLTVVRHKLTGHSGEGIELVDNPQDLPNAPLYVKYIPKDQEYRVHVGTSRVVGAEPSVTVIAVQRKARRSDIPDAQVNWKVRNHHNGFIFARGGFTPPQSVVDAAKQALVASSLDFGAVDVIYTKGGKAYVLEINTAPGLEGQTIADYAAFFRGDTE